MAAPTPIETSIWSQAYERLKAHSEEGAILNAEVVVMDKALARSSRWANAFVERDHEQGSRRR